jgi:tetratricopeptide (TPR) repeat protein
MSIYDHLSYLLSTRQWSELQRATCWALERDPTCSTLRDYLIVALIELKSFEQANDELSTLLAEEPDSARSHYLASHLARRKGDLSTASEHIYAAINIEPNNARYWLDASGIAISQHAFRHARDYIQRARQLDPDDPDIARLHVALCGSGYPIRRVGELTAALQLDPENRDLHIDLGDLYLNSLRDGKNAEQHFRTALRLDPIDRGVQRDLLQAVAIQSLLYRTLSLPMIALRRRFGIRHGLFAIIFLPVAVAWFIVGFALFTPAAKLYEILLVYEGRTGDVPVLSGLMRSVRRWRPSVRVGLVCAFIPLYWHSLFLLLGIDPVIGFIVAVLVANGHFMVDTILKAPVYPTDRTIRSIRRRH